MAIAIAASHRGHHTPLQSGSQATRTIAEVQQLLTAITQDGPRLGDPGAPVTLFYYGDLQCSVCRTFTLDGGFSQLVQRDVRAGHVQIVYRARQTATANPDTFQTQQVAALAAGVQRRFWQYAELFYRQQGDEHSSYVTNGYLTGLARQVPGLDLAAWRTARSDAGLAAQVRSDGIAARAAHVSSTPTLIITGPRGTQRLPNAVPDYAQLQQAIAAVGGRSSGRPSHGTGRGAQPATAGCGTQTTHGCTGH